MKIPTKYLYLGTAVAILIFAIFIRVIGLMQAAPALYWEEAALGYDAYSILKTGKDHHGNPWPIVAFESFGDWKPSLYFYTLVPFIALFNLQSWVVRIPSVLAGISTVIAVGLFSRKTASLFKIENSNLYGLIGLFIASISSWAIHFSRGGWEVNLATTLLTWGILLGLYGTQNTTKKDSLFKPGYIIASTLLLVLSVYAYHGTRLFSPLMGIVLAGYWLSHISYKTVSIKRLWPIIVSGSLAVVLILPLLLSLRSPQVSQRFAETSIFSNLDIIIESNQAKEKANNSFISKLLYHRYLLFSREVAQNYLDHFTIDFLFISGDSNPRHSSGYGGILYYQEILFLIMGVGLVIHKKQKVGWLLLAWWLLAVFPASLTKTTPHALRILPAMPAILVLISLGIGFCLEYFSEMAIENTSLKKQSSNVLFLFFTAALLLVYLGTFSFWWRHYWLIYPKEFSNEWQYGYEQMVSEVEMRHVLQSKPVYITREQGRPAMYYWFYTKTNPKLVQAENATAKKDQGEFLMFENIEFPNSAHEVAENQEGAIVASSEAGLEYFKQQNMTIEDLVVVQNKLGQTIWNIYTVTP